MAVGYSITISAVDRVTATLDAVNKKMARFTAPLQRAQAAVQKFGQVSGITRVGTAFGNVSRSANDAFQKVSQVIAPLGVISGAASVAGMARMVSAWAEWGSTLGFSAQRIGITADRLQGLQGAARLAGGSAGGLTSGLQTLGQTMYDAIGGRAPEAAVMFRTLGVAFSDGAGHARSVTAVLPELADKIAALKDPYAQAQAATALFGGAAEDMLPFLRRGSAGIREYEEAARRYGVTSAAGVAAANDMRVGQARLTLAVEGLGNSVSEKLAPILTPLLGQMADWIARNREWIATGIGTEVQRLATWLQGIDWGAVAAGAQRFADSAQHVVDMVGGWQPAIELFIGFMAARWALGVLAPFAQLATSIVGASVKLGLLAGEGIGFAISRFVALGAAATAAGAEAEVAMSSAKAFAIGAGLAIAGVAGNAIVNKVDPTDQAGSWIDQHVPGAAWIDNQASRIGLGRSYAQQREAAGIPEPAATAQPAHVRPTSAQSEAIYRASWQHLAETSTPPALSAAILGSMRKESGGDAAAVGDHGAAYGALQWHADRQAAFRQFSGHDIRGSSLNEQLDFAKWELTHNESGSAGRGFNGTGDTLNSAVRAGSANEAGQIYSKNVIRPGLTPDVQMAEARERGAYAQDFATRYANLGAPPAAPPPAAGPAVPPPVVAAGAPQQLAGGVGAAGAAGNAGPDGVVTVRLEHVTPAPAGFRASVRDTSGAMAGANIEQANVMGTLP